MRRNVNDDRRVSAYIDEMLNTPRGAYLITGWDKDLKQLKHYRWIRNQIVHEPGCSEENMCEPKDVLWLDNFYSRIMDQTDPLALYAKATKPRSVQEPKQTYTPQSSNHTYTQQTVRPKEKSKKPAGCLVFLIVALLLAATIFLVSRILYFDFGGALRHLIIN